MRICFVPIDNRPVCYSLASDITSVDKDIELLLPPRELLGGLTKSASVDELFNWLKNLPVCDAMILSLDTVAYGGLIPSRRSADSYEQIKARIDSLKEILLEKDAEIYAFSSIMRISNNNYNEEEKVYWKDYGKKIFEYSFSGGVNVSDIPKAIIEDYLTTRKRNFDINKYYLELQKEGLFNTLIFSKDDCAEKGFNVDESKELEALGGKVKTGADEIPLSLLARAIKKEIKVFVEFIEPLHKDLISNYEDVSIEKSVLGQLELCGFSIVETQTDADLVLVVNNFKNKQGELVMGWETELFNTEYKFPQKNFAVADVRCANGSDNNFVDNLLNNINMDRFCGYAGWNTSANTLGSLLALVKVKINTVNYDNDAFKKSQIIRFLDDWAYQANIRAKIINPCDISELMKPYEQRLSNIFEYNLAEVNYSYPWDRKFEVEVNI